MPTRSGPGVTDPPAVAGEGDHGVRREGAVTLDRPLHGSEAGDCGRIRRADPRRPVWVMRRFRSEWVTDDVVGQWDPARRKAVLLRLQVRGDHGLHTRSASRR